MNGRRIAAAAGPGPVEATEAAAGTGARHVVISVFDHPGYNGGGQAVVKMIAGRLAAHFEVTVITAARRRGTVVRDGVRYRKLPVGWAGPRGGQLLYHVLLPFAARRIPHDVWIESFTPPFSTSFLPLFSPAQVVGFAQSLSGEAMSRQYRLPFFLVERFGLRFYQDVVVLNSADCARVRRYSPSAAVQVIQSGIHKRRLDERLLGNGEHILYLGRIDIGHKGLDMLLAAYKRSELAMPLFIAVLAPGATSANSRPCWRLLVAMSAGWATSPASASRTCWNAAPSW